ncbi:hypothetical protein CB0940_06872 [Cercospora beticola]|uniref:Uncharacterized protein n=1 Tax=Cercospora beticola TaxID=122368 RepID=A0A2G5H7Q8_CERBT|nr:hypothetical protein CB0940_06872 [Cercospora beticola]PIA88564.1 hypothetical protein CB0940_06872 [Cercospora beticola]
MRLLLQVQRVSGWPRCQSVLLCISVRWMVSTNVFLQLGADTLTDFLSLAQTTTLSLARSKPHTSPTCRRTARPPPPLLQTATLPLLLPTVHRPRPLLQPTQLASLMRRHASVTQSLVNARLARTPTSPSAPRSSLPGKSTPAIANEEDESLTKKTSYANLAIALATTHTLSTLLPPLLTSTTWTRTAQLVALLLAPAQLVLSQSLTQPHPTTTPSPHTPVLPATPVSVLALLPLVWLPCSSCKRVDMYTGVVGVWWKEIPDVKNAL